MVRPFFLLLWLVLLVPNADAGRCSWFLKKIGLEQNYIPKAQILESPEIKYLNSHSDQENIKKFYYLWRFEDEMKSLNDLQKNYLNNLNQTMAYTEAIFKKYKKIKDYESFIQNTHILVSQGFEGNSQYIGHMGGKTETGSWSDYPGEYLWERVSIGVDEPIKRIELDYKDSKLGKFAPKDFWTRIKGFDKKDYPRNRYIDVKPENFPEEVYWLYYRDRESHHVHLYPTYTQVKEIYLPKMSETLNETLKELDESQMLKKLAHHFQIAINSHVFARRNMSVFMTHVNAILRLRGLNPIPHRNLDYLAMTKSTEEFTKDFLELVQEFN